MPYVSDRQRRFMHVKHPRIARRWDEEEKRVAKREPQPRFGGRGGVGHRIVDEDIPVGTVSKAVVEKINTERAFQLSRSLGARGRSAESRRAYQVMARAERGPKEQRELLAARSINAMEASERQGVHRAGRRRGITMSDTNREFFARSAAGRAGRPNPWVSKAYDPEARRQRRLGATEAALLIGGGAMTMRGVRGIRHTTRNAKAAAKLAEKWKDKSTASALGGRGITATRRDLGYVGAGTTGILGAGLVRQHAEGKRGRRWT